MEVWNFIQNQILGMKWLNTLIGDLLSKFGLDLESRIGGSLQFFFYDVIKIFILLSVLIFGISYIQSFFPPERTKQILSKFRGLSANIFAALLGTVTPFCSCSSIPLFIGFTSAGLPVGITFVEDFIRSAPAIDLEAESLTQRDRIVYAKEQLMSTIQKVAPYIFIGVGIGAAIHNFIPAGYVEALLGSSHWYSVPLATLVGVPMYADIFGAIPVAESLFAKGAGLGTVLSFMMAVTALSLPSLIMLRKAVKPKLLLTFTVIVTVGIIFIGYLFNACSFMF